MLFDVSKQKSIIYPQKFHNIFFLEKSKKKNFRNKYTIISERHFLYKVFFYRKYFLIKNLFHKKNDMRPRFRYVFCNVFWYPHLLNVTVRLVGRRRTFRSMENRLAAFFFYLNICSSSFVSFRLSFRVMKTLCYIFCYYIANRIWYCFCRGTITDIGEMLMETNWV